jgi:hypothetical protein
MCEEIEIPFNPELTKLTKGMKVVVINWFNKEHPFESGTDFRLPSPEHELADNENVRKTQKGKVVEYNIGVRRIKRVTVRRIKRLVDNKVKCIEEHLAYAII